MPSLNSIINLFADPSAALCVIQELHKEFCILTAECNTKTKLRFTLMGCFSASSTVMREVSLTREGLPKRASMYRPATAVAFLAE